MRIVFFGTPDFAAEILGALLPVHEVLVVVTQPDRPSGRGRAVKPSPVKALARARGVRVMQPHTLRKAEETFAELAAYGADVFVTAAYGLILPQRVLDMPKHGCVNVHASLLPKYRGAAPMQHAILNGETVTGITVMYMARGVDTGDMILWRELPILPGEHLPGLHDRMAKLGGGCILEALAQIAGGTARRVPQDGSAATYARMITKADGRIDWSKPPEDIARRVCAMDPWPGAFTGYGGQALKIWEAVPLPGGDMPEGAEPGTVLRADGEGVLVRAGGGCVLLTELQAVGGKRMAAGDYLRGRRINPGLKFEEATDDR